MSTQRKVVLTLIFPIVALYFVGLVSCAPAFSKNGQHPGHQKPAEVTYQTVPLTMQMEAGVPFHLADHPGGKKTIHSGIGWMMPFGRASYVGGIGYPEAGQYKPDYMDDDSWSAMFKTGLFCIYHLEDGDIYAFDGLMGNIESHSGDDGKLDYILNVIVGGTGRYKNANGILLGRTPGRFDVVAGGLPKILIKVMEGYINIAVDQSKKKSVLPTVGTRNPQKWPNVIDDFREGDLIPISIEMEAGRTQWNAWQSGTTIIAGNGWLEPFGRAQYHYGYGFEEASSDEGAKPDFMNETWLSSFPTKNLCIYHTAYGDIYAYDGIVGNLAPETGDGKVDYLLEVIVGGTKDYKGAKGIILGYACGKGKAVDDGYGGPYPLPDSIIKIMEGYIVK